jgi:uncharacterized repeat protein (TIGR01451 family)/LPXTG-motif cell wall-anchored protein
MSVHRGVTRSRLPLTVALALVGCLLALVMPTTVASAAPTPSPSPSPSPSASTTTPSAPQLSIAVDNGRTTAVVGDRLSYTITVRNLGSTQVRGLRVSQTMPAGLRFESAGSHGVAKAGTVTWTLNLKANGSTTLHTDGTVTKTPAQLLRLATVACARLSDKGLPLVCASHSDQLPAGAAAELALAGNEETSWPSAGLVTALAGVGVLAAAAALVFRRRRRSIPR